MSSAFLTSLSSANPNVFSKTSNGGLNLPTSVLLPAAGVRGSYFAGAQSGAVPQHVDMRTLTPTDLDTDARAYGQATARFGHAVIVATYRASVGDVVYMVNGQTLPAANVQAALTNAFALAQH